MRWTSAAFDVTDKLTGTYYDGHSAAGVPVTASAESHGLTLYAGKATPLAVWNYAQVRCIDDDGVEEVLRLAHGEDPARLVLDGGAGQRALLKKLGVGRGSRRRGFGYVAAVTAVSLICVAGAGFGLWHALPRIAQEAVVLMPVSWDAAMGQRAKARLDKTFGIGPGGGRFCAAPAGHAALRALTARLAAAADTSFDFRPVVVDQAPVNALALPGGHIYLFRGLIEGADTPEQLAGVLAHEMAHVIHRDGMQALFREFGLTALAEALGGGSLAGLGHNLLTLSYSREAEAAADMEGQRILAAAGLRADGLRAFLTKLMASDSKFRGPLALLSTHPLSGERVAKLNPPKGGDPVMSATEWTALRAICGPGETEG